MRSLPGWAGWSVALGLAVGVSGCGSGFNMDLMKTLQSSASVKRSMNSTRGEVNKYMAGVDDTARLVYVGIVENAPQVFSIQPDGKDARQLTSEDDRFYKCRPSWSLDHKQIAYFHYSSDRPDEGKAGIALMKADGSDHRLLLVERKIDTTKTRISWKPDGSVLYIQERDFPSVLFGYDVVTGQQVETVRIPKGSFIKEVQTLSPDAQILAGTGPFPGNGIIHMGAVKRSGGPDLDFMKFFQQAPYHLGTVVWSYDSMFVAYELDVTVIIMNSTYAPGFKFYPISPMEADTQFTGPTFSPTGQFIACAREKSKEGNVGSGDKEVRSDIWIMQITGAKPRQLTDTGTCFDPNW